MENKINVTMENYNLDYEEMLEAHEDDVFSYDNDDIDDVIEDNGILSSLTVGNLKVCLVTTDVDDIEESPLKFVMNKLTREGWVEVDKYPTDLEYDELDNYDVEEELYDFCMNCAEGEGLFWSQLNE